MFPRHQLSSLLLSSLLLATSVGLGCVSSDEQADPRDECATCAGGKADTLEGTCDANIVIQVANTASFEQLDDDAGLNARAAENIVSARASESFETLADVDAVPFVGSSAIEALLGYGVATDVECDKPTTCLDVVVVVANTASFDELDDEMALDKRAAEGIVSARPFETLSQVDAVSFVGTSALASMRAFGEANDLGCDSDGLGLISDLDKTVIPPSDPDLAVPPYPGVVTLYGFLLRDSMRITYVTARKPDRVVEVPAWLTDHGLPPGPIETGISGIPSVAAAEKVRDITKTFGKHPARSHVLFGDSSHVDPEAYREILATLPEQFRAGLIHKVTDSVPDERIQGLRLFNHHAEAAAILAGLGEITAAEAQAVFEAATAEGLELTQSEFDEFLEAEGL